MSHISHNVQFMCLNYVLNYGTYLATKMYLSSTIKELPDPLSGHRVTAVRFKYGLICRESFITPNINTHCESFGVATQLFRVPNILTVSGSRDHEKCNLHHLSDYYAPYPAGKGVSKNICTRYQMIVSFPNYITFQQKYIHISNCISINLSQSK